MQIAKYLFTQNPTTKPSTRLASTTTKPGLSIVSLNCYLVPRLMARWRPFDAPSMRNQEERAKGIAQFSSDKDILLFQEVWGCQVDVLQNGLPNHQVLPGYQSFGWGATLNDYLDPIYSYITKRGGLWTAFSKEFPLMYQNRHTYTISESKSGKGVTASLLDVGYKWPGKYLLCVNTHLDPVSIKNQKLQMDEAYKFLGKVLEDIKQIPKSRFLLENCGVIFAGDLNTASTSPEYKHYKSKFQLRDLYKEYITANNLKEQPSYDANNNSLIPWDDDVRRIDYIFSLDTYGSMNFLKLKADRVDIPTEPKELSDHYPVIATINY